MSYSVDTTYTVELAKELLSIPSPGGDTRQALTRVEKEFARFGLPTHYTNKGALVATFTGKTDNNARVITAHIDTLGAVVRRIKPNGRLKVVQIGGFAWGSVEGENAVVKTADGRTYTGSLLPEKASVHVYSDAVRDTLRTDDTVEIRLDELVSSRADVEALGIHEGDFVTFDPRAVLTPSGFLKARYLDDKACVANLFAMVKYLKENDLTPEHTLSLYISNYEEIGHGVSWTPKNASEILALDIGPVGPEQQCSETDVCIVAKDSRTPYDFTFRQPPCPTGTRQRDRARRRRLLPLRVGRLNRGIGR